MRTLIALLLSWSIASAQAKTNYPKAELRNAHVRMTVYLPDATKGFYHGTRFDWSGVIADVKFNNNTLFGPWKDTHDPASHDDITGPAEEFRTPLGYDTAKVGETFLKLGVGTLIKPEEKAYRFAHKYAIKHAGQWEVAQSDDEITFKQGMLTDTGYGYKYVKTVKLLDNLSGFLIKHELNNVGTKVIVTDWYNHNFFNVNADPVGPNYTLQFPFEPKTINPVERFEEVLSFNNSAYHFTKPLDSGTIFAEIGGFKADVEHHALSLHHTPSRVNLLVQGDVPMSKLLLWGIKGAICPEPYVDINLKPGDTKTWAITYTITNGLRKVKW
ncbi:hypothetical protein BH11PLA2_BH11PLA2_21490 [soil metagenome]